MKHPSSRVLQALLRGLVPTAVVALAALPISSCGSGAGTGGPSSSSSVQPSAGDTAVAGDNATGEGTPVRFVSARNHYRVDFPALMSEATDGTATGTRGTEQLTVRVVTGAQAADPAAYARAGVSTLRSQSPAYKEVAPLGPVTLGGRTVQKVVYTWTSGTSAVTGNPQQLVTAVYFIPRDSSTLAVLSYSIAPTLYDPQGADDIATTFAWQ